jgi:hypothetical protein
MVWLLQQKNVKKGSDNIHAARYWRDSPHPTVHTGRSLAGPHVRRKRCYGNVLPQTFLGCSKLAYTRHTDRIEPRSESVDHVAYSVRSSV